LRGKIKICDNLLNLRHLRAISWKAENEKMKTKILFSENLSIFVRQKI